MHRGSNHVFPNHVFPNHVGSNHVGSTHIRRRLLVIRHRQTVLLTGGGVDLG